MDCQFELEILKKIKADLKAAGFIPDVFVRTDGGEIALTFDGTYELSPLTVSFFIDERGFNCSNDGFISLADPRSFQKIVSTVSDCYEWGTDCLTRCPLG